MYSRDMDEFNRYLDREKHRCNKAIAQSLVRITISLIIILIGLTALLAPAIMKVANPQTYTVVVQSKEVKVDGKTSRFLVFTTDPMTGESHVFEVTDSLFKWRFDSADTYNIIREGETYELTTGGYRTPFFSMYPNIYEVKKIDSPIKESKANG